LDISLDSGVKESNPNPSESNLCWQVHYC
jgi:hypothetical protein